MSANNSQPLLNLAVIVTRPAQQATTLCNAIEQLGGVAIPIPSILIESIDINSQIAAQPFQITNNDIAIFVSRNSVLNSKSLWLSLKQLPTIIAIGPGTAQTLTSLGLPVTAIPATYSSEGILALPQLDNLKNKTLYLCCGTHSRKTLENELIKRGASVIPIICYQRKCPTLTQEITTQLFNRFPDITVTTSRASLVYWKEMILQAKAHWLLSLPLLVINTKYFALAKQLGFQKIFIADNATDNAIIAALVQHAIS